MLSEKKYRAKSPVKGPLLAASRKHVRDARTNELGLAFEAFFHHHELTRVVAVVRFQQSVERVVSNL